MSGKQTTGAPVTRGTIRLRSAPWHVPLEEQVLCAALVRAFHGEDAFLLGHAMDGVLWGQICGGQLALAADVLGGPLLRTHTLLDLSVFSRERELRLWRRDGQVVARLMEESPDGGEVFQAQQRQSYLLLGANKVGEERGGFVVYTGPAGQRHTPPLVAEKQPQRLDAMHYYRSDESGLLRPAAHRLLDLRSER